MKEQVDRLPLSFLGIFVLNYTKYQPRLITFTGVRTVQDYRLKMYSIIYGNVPFRTSHFDKGLALAAKELPQPAVNTQRPGVGFSILHQGRTGDYLILCWWDQENELPTRIYVSKSNDVWRPAQDGESFCVWDLGLLWWEREAYVNTVLMDSFDSVERYLGTTMTGYA